MGEVTKYLAAVDLKAFEALDKNLANPALLPEAWRGDCKFNRYNDIMPNPTTRVVLEAQTGNPNAEYINASFVRDYTGKRAKYIAAQGPLTSTTASFIRMLWEQETPAIVMVTNLVEGNKVKCARYFPENVGTPLVFGDITVTLLATKNLSGYIRNELQLLRGAEVRTLVHYWYTTWPDHGIPQDADGKIFTRDVLFMLMDVRKLMAARAAPAPMVVHCSAGIGRSGAIIAIDCGLDAVEAGFFVDLLEITRGMRFDRMAMIQHAAQYKFACYAVAQHTLSLLKRGVLGAAGAPAPAHLPPIVAAPLQVAVCRVPPARPAPPPGKPPPAPPALVTLRAYVNQDNTPDVLSFAAHEPVVVLEKTDVWWKARVGDQEGWVLPELVGPAPSPAVAPVVGTSAVKAAQTLVTLCAFDNPDGASDMLAYTTGQAVVVLDKSPHWWRCRIGSKEGWVLPTNLAAVAIEPDQPGSTTAAAVTAASAAALAAAPTTIAVAHAAIAATPRTHKPELSAGGGLGNPFSGDASKLSEPVIPGKGNPFAAFAAAAAEPSFEDMMDMVLAIEGNVPTSNPFAAEVSGSAGTSALASGHASGDDDDGDDDQVQEEEDVADGADEPALPPAPPTVKAIPVVDPASLVDVPLVPNAFYSNLQPWTFVEATGRLDFLAGVNDFFVVPRLPAGLVREPCEIAWPAVVGYDQVWRHAISGAVLAKERPVADRPTAKAKLKFPFTSV